MEMKQELINIAEQINAKELNLAKFNLSYDNKQNLISVKKGNKAISIQYDYGSDTYILKQFKFKDFEITKEETFNNIYWDSLKQYIQDFFNFEYVRLNLSEVAQVRMEDNSICRRCQTKLNNWRDILYVIWTAFPMIMCYKCRRKQKIYEIQERKRLKEWRG